MHKAVDEMADEKTFRGYPPEYGYDFLLNAINENDYRSRGIGSGNSGFIRVGRRKRATRAT